MRIAQKGKPNIGSADIRAIAAAEAFGRPLIVNVWRGFIAEAVVRSGLGSDWIWCSADYSAWDFERTDGLKLEVKQSAARQTWAASGSAPSKAIFDVATRVGRYDKSSKWIEERKRWADIYVFAHHAISDATADHCDPSQWYFYVVPANCLPEQASISLRRIQRIAAGCSLAELAQAVDAAGRYVQE